MEETCLYLAAELSKRNLAYVQLPDSFLAKFPAACSGTLILPGGLNKEGAEQLVRDG
jgi:N-ethylmaleimide reductase